MEIKKEETLDTNYLKRAKRCTQMTTIDHIIEGERGGMAEDGREKRNYGGTSGSGENAKDAFI